MCRPEPDCCQLQSSRSLGSALNQREWPHRLHSQAHPPSPCIILPLASFKSQRMVLTGDRLEEGSSLGFLLFLCVGQRLWQNPCLPPSLSLPLVAPGPGLSCHSRFLLWFQKGSGPEGLPHGACLASQIFHGSPVLKSFCFMYLFLGFWIDLAWYREHGNFWENIRKSKIHVLFSLTSSSGSFK